MKKLLFSIFAITCALTGFATEQGDTTETVMSLNDIIAAETQSKTDYDNINRLRDIWDHDTYLNISLNKTKFSSDEFPSTQGKFHNEFKNDFGLGVKMGHTYKLHKKPIGSVLFFGIDYNWIDLNFNQYKADSVPSLYDEGEQVTNMPWHNKKMTLQYGMSAGPSLTLYPFATLHNKGADKIRLHLYFHVGYAAAGALVKDVRDGTVISDEWAWAHGLNTAFGTSLTWDHIGIGFELRNDGNMKYKAVHKVVDTGKMKVKEKTTRIYLQFRW